MSENTLQGFKELQTGTALNNGKYTIEKKISEGGFGITYKAVQNGLNRIVCIKEYFPAGKCVRNTHAKTLHLQGFSEDQFEKYRQAFVKEARTLAKLRHPNIVEVMDVFDENNTSYMVMPFIEGQSFRNIVKRQGKLPYPEAVNYIAQITDAVAYIHKKNILHRDIKPDNVIITPDFKAILIDFGSAREFVHDQTQAYTSVVTHGYAPTEQYTANSRKGAYTDIYAIGATFYFALTGKTPLEAVARMTQKMPEPKELAPKTPAEANRTIMKAMQIKAENRHQNVQDFMDDLRNLKPSILVDETIGGTKVTVTTGTKMMIFGIAFASLLLLAIGGYLLYPKINNWFVQNKTEQRINEAKDNMLNGKVENLKVWIYKDKIYLRPTNGILDTTLYYHIVNGSLKTTQTLPLKHLFAYIYTYSGKMQNGFPNGEGKAIYNKIDTVFSDSKPVYKGSFHKGLRHGTGRFTYPDGTIFEGDYKNDMKKHGKETYPDGKIFEGGYEDNMKKKGKLTHPNGDYYDGEWKDDKLNGEVYFKDSNGEGWGYFDNDVLQEYINK